MVIYRWELPLASADNNNTGHIHGNAKIHLFNQETGFSHCKRYWQMPGYTEEIEYNSKDEQFCKKCLKKYRKLVGENT